MTLEVLYFDGCPNHQPTVELAREVLLALGLEAEIREVRVETAEDAQAHRFVGSPTLRVDGDDIEPQARARTDFGLSCRIYTSGGMPGRELLVEALRTKTGGRE